VNRFRTRLPFALAVCLLGAGCINLDPRPDPTRYYDLAGTTPDSVASTNGIRLGLWPTEIPDYLNTRQIVTRINQHRINYANYERWAEPLPANLDRALHNHLLADEKVAGVRIGPWNNTVRLDRVVRVRLIEFEGHEDGSVQLAAEWSVETRDAESAESAHRTQRLKGSWTPGDYGDLAAQMSSLLKQLCADILAEI
jgi:hypothetical protein